MALPQPTLQATVTDSSIEFVGLVALCGLLLSSGFFSSRSLLPRRYSRELVCKAAYWPRYRSRRLVPYVVYTGCNCVPRDDLRYFRHRARFFLLVLVLERFQSRYLLARRLHTCLFPNACIQTKRGTAAISRDYLLPFNFFRGNRSSASRCNCY